MTGDHSEPHGEGVPAETGIDRAAFIRRAGGAGLALAALAAGGPLAPAALAHGGHHHGGRRLVPRHRIGIGLEEYAFSAAPPADPYSKLEEIHDIGYRATELIEFVGFPGGVDRAREVRRLLRRAHLRGVGNFHLTNTTPGLRDALDTFVREDRAAGMLDFGMVATEHDPAVQTEAYYRGLAREFNAWGEVTRRAGMRFYVHNEAWVFDRDPVTGKVLYDVWIEETDPDLVYFCLDLMWPSYRGFDPVDYIRRLERHDRITHFHVKDWNGQQAAPGAPTSSTQVDVGDGVIDFRRIFKALKRPEKYWYIVEREGSPDPSATARRSYEYLAGLRG